MRYESFYPFAHHPTTFARQQNINPATFMPPMQQRTQPNANQRLNPFPNHSADASAGQGLSKLENYMQTADRFLATAQQFAPLVQQFAPMVSNLPAMWRLYKGFQSMPDQPTASHTNRPVAAGGRAGVSPETTGPRPSTPRIFQPPSP